MRGNRLFKALDRWLGIPLVALLGLLRSRRPPAPLGPGGRVLLIKQSAMGDTLLLLPVLKALRETVGPQGRVDVLCTRVNAAVLQGQPWSGEALLFEPGAMLARPWRLASLVLGLRRRRYDWALDMDQWLRSSALLAFAGGARARAGFRSPGQHKHGLFHASAPNDRLSHESRQFAAVAALAGAPAERVEPYGGFLLRHGLLGARREPRGERPLVLLHPGAGGAGAWQREWPGERYAQLGTALRAAGARIALSGSGALEAGACAAIEAQMGPADEACINGGLEALVGLLNRADLLICGNTGVMHLAAGLGRPVLGLHGPTSAIKWGPLAPPEDPTAAQALRSSLPCSPCLSLGFEFGCRLRPCMESIRVGEVQAAALGRLGIGA